ncbi:hypothetical protein WJX74_008865 [Apatococcus lobatus]|uniref:Arginine decarboxylase n=1 Tax=Apatococcus lobatus TaxID=904363 RepID=A0AAW1S6E3_9CHLO
MPGVTPLHIPGHKMGSDAIHAIRKIIGSEALQHDMTELEGLDILSTPTGCIKAAQDLAAAAFGAEATWFLVNGSTVGIQAAIMACSGPSDVLIIARNCHMSAFSGMVLSGCKPLWVAGVWNNTFGVVESISTASLRAAFTEARSHGLKASAALLVSPTYYGTCSNVQELAKVCHEHGVPLIVDEAHGPHFAFHGSFPQAALAQGADVVIQSTHKTLSALTQSSMLHVQGSLVQRSRISSALEILQSSSPSYLLMASLDAARATAAAPGAFDEALAASHHLHSHLPNIPGLQILSPHHLHQPAGVGVDPLRVTVRVRDLDITGYFASEWLEDNHAVVPELATDQLVVLALGIGNAASAQSMHEAATQSFTAQPSGNCSDNAADSCTIPRVATSQNGNEALEVKTLSAMCDGMSPRNAAMALTQRVETGDAAGRISAELLCPYPPGIPLVFPGERISPQNIHALQTVLAHNGRIRGAADPQLREIQVVVE